MEEYVLKVKKDGTKVTVRELQLQVLEIMDEIHRVCVKNDIPYFLLSGSALGICNYQGFIPWDDDMDISIFRKDWNRFIEALEKDLNKEKFYFDCFEKDKVYNVLIPSMKIRKKGTYIKEVNPFLPVGRKGHDGIFVDVIIADYVCDKKWVDKLWRSSIMPIALIICFLNIFHINGTLLKKLVLKIAAHYGKKYDGSNHINDTISFPWVQPPGFPKEDVLPLTLYDFEGRKFYSYHNIKKICQMKYGPNCLKKWNGTEWVETLPIEKRHPGHTKDINLNGETKEE